MRRNSKGTDYSGTIVDIGPAQAPAVAMGANASGEVTGFTAGPSFRSSLTHFLFSLTSFLFHRIAKGPGGAITDSPTLSCRFVPLPGKFAWQRDS